MTRSTAKQSFVLTRRILVMGALASTAACTVQPLYSTAPGSNVSPAAAALASVDVKPIRTRVGQQVRNELLFLLHGGGTGTASPNYIADLAVSVSDTAVFSTPAPDGVTEITSQRLTLTGTIRLTSTIDGALIGTQTRRATASYDSTRQQFANDRAKRDAENRAARELAEQLRAAIVTSLPAA